MTKIHKKILPEYFEKILSGEKKLELRLADFAIDKGDTLVLEEWDNTTQTYTGRALDVTATYILKTKDIDFWTPEEVEQYGYQIIQFEANKQLEVLRPKVGVGVMIFKDGKILLGERCGSHGENEYAFPGGHLEYLESFEACARRETMEECGIEIENVRFNIVSNVTKYAPKHFVDVEVIADWKSGEPVALEPHKCKGWDWYDIDNLPHPMFEMCERAVEGYKTNRNFFDAVSS